MTLGEAIVALKHGKIIGHITLDLGDYYGPWPIR